MAKEFDRTYNVPLGRAWIYPKQRRSKRAVKLLREFAIRHGKSEQVKISEEVSEQIWENGIRNPPRKIKIRLVKDKDGLVTVNTLDSAKTEVKEVETKDEQIIDVKPELEDKEVKELPEEVKPEVTEEVKPEVTEEVKPEVTEEVKPEVTEEVKPEVTEEVKPEVTEEVKPEEN